jgi:hypothetical protein
LHRELVDGLLPRLERHLDRSIQRYRAGGLTGKQLTDNFHRALERQFLRLTRQGVAEADAALVIHAVVLILGVPGLRAEAAETQLPVEIIEYRALQAAATDLEQNYQVNARRALRRIAALVAYYRE